MSEEQKNNRWLRNTILAGSIFVAGFAAGDFYDLIEKTTLNRQIYNRSVEDGFPENYLDYRTEIVINKKGRVELYFGAGDKDNFKRVRPDGTVGSIDESIRSGLTEVKTRIEDFVESMNSNESIIGIKEDLEREYIDLKHSIEGWFD